MATFSSSFLGCKISHTDVQELRERLDRGRPRRERGSVDVAVVNTCCVTHEAVRKSRRKPARRLAAARAVYVTGCAANLEGASRAPENVEVVRLRASETADFVAGPSARSDASRRRRPRSVRAFVKIQDGCSFSCASASSASARRVAEPARAAVLAEVVGASRRAPRDRPDRHQPRVLSRPTPATASPRLVREVGAVRASSGSASPPSRSTTLTMPSSRDARDADVSPHLHVRCSPATTRAPEMGEALRRRDVPARVERPAAST
jgi:hypothetical protein